MGRNSSNVKLDKVRAARCSFDGLSILKKIPDDTVDVLYTAYMSEPHQFTNNIAQLMQSLLAELSRTKDPKTAIKIAFLSGLLVDRMTNKELIEANGVETTVEYKRTSEGLQAFNKKTLQSKVIPYGEEVENVCSR
jgi:hypothetical protein